MAMADAGSGGSGSLEEAAEVFAGVRPRLFGIAYRMLSSVTEAEDLVQDVWLRWQRYDRTTVNNPAAFLATTITRLAINVAQSARARRETYIGPWLPEPILTGGAGLAGPTDLTELIGPDVADEVTHADTVSLAMLVVLETLSPLERAVFVLREAFALPYAEIGEVLDRTEAAVRQLARRARDHVRERRPRYDADPATQQRVTERFLAAAGSGDLASLLQVLAPDVTLHGDGGGVVKAPLRVISTADKVGRFLLGIATNAPPEPQAYLASVNGQVAVVVTSRGVVHSVLALDVTDGRVTMVRLIANPDKLGALRDIERVGTPIPLG
jgi:RNA polymerase sigma-70 factor, ECF subfamily